MGKTSFEEIEAASRKRAARPRQDGKVHRAAGAARLRRAPARPLRAAEGHGPAAIAAPPEGPPAEGEGGNQFHVVVVGTGPVGKTSLVSALLGRSAGATGATFGTTHHGCRIPIPSRAWRARCS